MSKQKSRPQRWAEAASKAEDALSELVELQTEYQDWLDGLPENLQSGHRARSERSRFTIRIRKRLNKAGRTLMRIATE